MPLRTGLILSLAILISSCTKKTAFESANSLQKSSSAIENVYLDDTTSYMNITFGCTGISKIKFDYDSERNQTRTETFSCSGEAQKTERLPVTAFGLSAQNFSIRISRQGNLTGTQNVWSIPDPNDAFDTVKQPWTPPDKFKPVITITKGALKPASNDPNPVFEATASDSGGSGLKDYKCSLNGSTPGPCPGLTILSSTPDGTSAQIRFTYLNLNVIGQNYSLIVSASDNAGNTTDSAPWNWTYDPSVPICSYTLTPASYWTGFGVLNRGVMVSCSNSPSSVTCAVLGPKGTTNSYPCPNNTVVNLPYFESPQDGKYNVTATAINPLGGANGVVTFEYGSDVQYPNAIAICPPQYTKNTTITIDTVGTDDVGSVAIKSGLKQIDCAIKQLLPVPAGSATRQTSCTFPPLPADPRLDEGKYEFYSIAVDNANNEKNSAICTVTIDKTAPTLQITSAVSGTVDLLVDPNTLTPSATFGFQFSDSGSGADLASFECSISYEAAAPVYGACTSTTSHTGAFSNGTGHYTFWVRAKDKAGNSGSTQLGNINYSVAPIVVKIFDFDTSDTHACIVTDRSDFDPIAPMVNGPLMCWGGDSNLKVGAVLQAGQASTAATVPYFDLGLRTSVPLSSRQDVKVGDPSAIPSAADYTPVQVSLGKEFSCVLLANGKVRCWGHNDSGQLGGIGPNLGSQHPPYSGETGFGQGELSPDGQTTYQTPTYSNSSQIINVNLKVSLGHDMSGAAFANKYVMSRPYAGPTDSNYRYDKFISISAGSDFVCGVAAFDNNDQSKNSVWCWGDNGQGQLGVSQNSTDVNLAPWPHEVIESSRVPLRNVKKVASGNDFACAIADPTGSVYCWGGNGSDQIAGASGSKSTYAVNVSNAFSIGYPVEILDLSAGKAHACAVTRGSTNGLYAVACWGGNNKLQLGCKSADNCANTENIPHFVDFTHLAAPGDTLNDCSSPSGRYDLPLGCVIDQVELGGNNSCVRIRNTKATATHKFAKTYCWGDNSNEQIGFPNPAQNTTNRNLPYPSAFWNIGVTTPFRITENYSPWATPTDYLNLLITPTIFEGIAGIYSSRNLIDYANSSEVASYSGNLKLRVGKNITQPFMCGYFASKDSFGNTKGQLYCWGSNHLGRLGAPNGSVGDYQRVKEAQTTHCTNTDSADTTCSIPRPIRAQIQSNQYFTEALKR